MLGIILILTFFIKLKYCKFPGCNCLVKSGYCEQHAKRERYCAFPRCPNLATCGSWCEVHKPERRADIRRGSPSSRGYDHQWVKVRDAYIKRHPLCERCLVLGFTTEATLVHHKQRIAEGGARYDFQNLMSLCYRCHEQIHSEQGDYSKKQS